MTMDLVLTFPLHRLHAHLQPCPRRIVGLVANGLALTWPVVASCCIGFPFFPCARVGVSVARCGEKCEKRARTRLIAPGLGSQSENGNPGLQVRRGWPARRGMASSGPLAGPDAKNPAFPKIFFLTNAVVCPRSQGRAPQAGEETDGLWFCE